jgi:hypothetical protein
VGTDDAVFLETKNPTETLQMSLKYGGVRAVTYLWFTLKSLVINWREGPQHGQGSWLGRNTFQHATNP